jgi:hypothetical protein
VPPWVVISPRRAAGIPPIITVIEPLTMESGGPTQVAISPTRAAGIMPIITVGQQGGRMGPPTWGMGGVPGVTIGQICISPTLAAEGISQILRLCVIIFENSLNFTRWTSDWQIHFQMYLHHAGAIGILIYSRSRCLSANQIGSTLEGGIITLVSGTYFGMSSIALEKDAPRMG